MKIPSQASFAGRFAITFITDLCHGIDPATLQYLELCQHLVNCFTNGSTYDPNSYSSTEGDLEQTCNQGYITYILLLQATICFRLFAAKQYASYVITQQKWSNVVFVITGTTACSCVNLSKERVKQLKDPGSFCMDV